MSGIATVSKPIVPAEFAELDRDLKVYEERDTPRMKRARRILTALGAVFVVRG